MHCQTYILSVCLQFVQSVQKYQNQIYKVPINDNKDGLLNTLNVTTFNITAFKFFSN